MTNEKTEWCTVPVEPTATQVRAGQLGVTTTCAKAIYAAMLAVAPPPPQSEPCDRNAVIEECLQCYSPDDSATDWADKIRRLKL